MYRRISCKSILNKSETILISFDTFISAIKIHNSQQIYCFIKFPSSIVIHKTIVR